MAATVTIDKVYFETLLRRAEFDVSGTDLTTPVDLPTVSIPKVDHDNLRKNTVGAICYHGYTFTQKNFASFVCPIHFLHLTSTQASLRDALYRGGIALETLEILIRGDPVPRSQDDNFTDSGTANAGASFFGRPQTNPVRVSRSPIPGYENAIDSGLPSKNHLEAGHLKDRTGSYIRQYSFGQDDSSFVSEFDKEDQRLPRPRREKQQYARAEQRTILLKNLSDRTTHKDIVDIVRGGAVLDIFLRSNERSASVSFIEGPAAQEFMNYVRRNDIYIHGKRLEFAWNERQFILPGHVANKIGIGATRNLIIRGVHPNITEERLREDLDHIHNLIIISISFKNGDAFLSLNSIHNSLFARTCMMSRATYKGMRIEWYSDECAQPLPKIQAPKKENVQQPPKNPQPMVNRFQMLNMDGTEDGSEEDKDDDPAGLGGFSALTINHRSPWNASTVAA